MEYARWIVACVGVVTATGGLMADWFIPFGAKQHLKNPLWTPHAKFHNAQAVFMGLLQGLMTLGLLVFEAPGWDIILLSALITSIYWVALMAAPIFPGTAWIDPEFDADTPRPLVLHPQQLIGFCILALLFAALAFAYFGR